MAVSLGVRMCPVSVPVGRGHSVAEELEKLGPLQGRGSVSKGRQSWGAILKPWAFWKGFLQGVLARLPPLSGRSGAKAGGRFPFKSWTL